MSTANKITLVNDRVERAKSFLLSQFKDQPNITALVDALVSELQELENVLIELQTIRTLAGAKGWWLDQIGEELDIPRGGYSDNDYKTAIKIEMAKRTSSASIEDILRIVSLITSDKDARLTNPHQYLLELWSYFFCVADSESGLNSIASLFPINSRVLLVQHETKPFKLNQIGSGFGNGAKLNSIVLYKNGITNDPRFVTLATQQYVPPVTSSPTIVTSPYISGSGIVGQVITLNVGTYDGDEPITIAKQWLRDGADISGATGNTYTLVSADAGKVISVRITVSNTYGSIFTYTNNIPVASVIPPVSPLTVNIGMKDYTTVRYTMNTSVTNKTTVLIKSDGFVQYLQNDVLEDTQPYLVTTGTSLGNDYSFTYSVVSGNEFATLNQNVPRVLSTDLALNLSVTSIGSAVKDGTYDFTIFKTSDPTISKTVRVYISSEIVSDV